jgi:magnesium chelatase accessory protein
MALDWLVDGANWPNREFSRFVPAGGLRWHVQVLPAVDTNIERSVLLIHGTGASSHSWRDVAPLLTSRFNVVIPDLPGHGFSAPAPTGGASLEGMGRSLTALLAALGMAPRLLVGHSAGAAIAASMSLSGAMRPHQLVAINGALLPLRGLEGRLLSPLAKLLAASSAVPTLLVSLIGDRSRVARMLAATGSAVDEPGQRLYERLIRDRDHVAGALAMMAHWDLYRFESGLPGLRAQLHLLTGSNDRTVPPSQSRRVAKLLPHAWQQTFAGLGHLAHEERPELFAQTLFAIADGFDPGAAELR